MIHRLVRAPGPYLIFGLNLIKSGIKSVVQDRRTQFVQRWPRTNRAIVSDVLFVPFFCDGFLSVFCAMFLEHSFSCLNTSLKICFIYSFVAASQLLVSSARIPLLSHALPFLSLLIAAWISSSMIKVFFLLSFLLIFLHQQPWCHGSRYFEALSSSRI